MRHLISIICLFMLISCQEGYVKEDLPTDFTYNITSNLSNVELEKNEVYVSINKDLTVGQIATLADIVYKNLPKQRRSYIFYTKEGSVDVWATSHYDPELDININGVNSDMVDDALSSVKGKIVGKWRTDKYGFSVVLMQEKDGTMSISTLFNFGDPVKNIVQCTETKDGLKITYPNDNGEFFIVNKNKNLDLYSSNGKYGEAFVIE